MAAKPKHRKWSTPEKGGSQRPPGVFWSLQEQWLLGGGCDVQIICTIVTGTSARMAEWYGVTLSDAQIDDSYVQVTLEELRMKVAEGSVTEALDLVALLETL